MGDEELGIGGRRRTFTIRLPRARPDDRPVPLVLVLHGNHPDAAGRLMRQWTTFDKQADAWGFAIAYPDGWHGCWADGRGVTTADEAGVDDVAFLRAIINWSAARHLTGSDRRGGTVQRRVHGPPPRPGGQHPGGGDGRSGRRPAKARTNFHEALAHARDGACVVEATAGLALATSMMASEVEPTPSAPLVVDHPLLRRAAAWRLVREGKISQAREELTRAAQRCALAGRRTDELVLLHDIVRLGDPRGAAVRVAALADDVDGPYAATIVAHTAAAAARDAAGVAAAGESFAGLGARCSRLT